MKVTIKKSTEPKQLLRLEDIEFGSIIEFDTNDSPIGLVISSIDDSRDIALLKHSIDGLDWFQLAAGWKTQPIKRILGKLTEIIVEPI